MDAASSKALLRSRMKEAAQKRDNKRIDSPLVRYNDLGQPICKVCNVVVKSESLWPAHLATRQHKEAVEEIKTRAKAVGVAPAKATVAEDTAAERTKQGSRPSSTLPSDFFDSTNAKRVNAGDAKPSQDPIISTTKVRADALSSSHEDIISMSTEAAVSVQQKSSVSAVTNTLASADDIYNKNRKIERVDEPGVPDQLSQDMQDNKVSGQAGKGMLPEGFFDNVDADHRARGLEPPKYDIQDEWKEFQKTIREDVQVVDFRLEEEEFDAAEDREELERLEQRAFLVRIEKLRKTKLEKAAAVASKAPSTKSFDNFNPDTSEDSASDEDSEEDNLLVDWRAKQL